jgi:hypothetical protein
MPGEIIFKSGVTVQIEEKGQCTDPLLVYEDGLQVTVRDVLKRGHTRDAHLVLFYYWSNSTDGRLALIHNETRAGDELGLPYVESITHRSSSKER